jgi:fatty acid desaturase
MRLSYNGHRAIAGIWLIVFLLAAANYLLEFGFFGRYAKLVMVLVLAVGIIYLTFFMPTRQEMREHREAKRAARNRNDA